MMSERSAENIDSLRRKFLSMIEREELTATEFGAVITLVRERHEWASDSDTDTQAVADYFGVSVATITQMKRFMTLPAEVHALVDAGQMTVSVAVEIAVSPKDNQLQVLQEGRRAGEEGSGNGTPQGQWTTESDPHMAGGGHRPTLVTWQPLPRTDTSGVRRAGSDGSDRG